jgi:phosphoribosylformylglycinamidine synthase
LVLRTAGTNCDFETAHAFALAGAEAERLHVQVLLEGARRLDEFQILALPGGFSYGDDLGAGTILANKLRTRLRDALESFAAAGRLVLGICNGFQVLVRLGLLPGIDGEARKLVSLVENRSGLFEARWVRMRAQTERCPLLVKGEIIEAPVAHKEGRLVVRDADLLGLLKRQGQIALSYIPRAPGRENAAPDYPDNPNGSIEAVAGLISPSGRVLGLMPHPERSLRRLHHPNWTRAGAAPAAEDDWGAGDGFRIFERAVREASRAR